jgi:hypothetical protein
MGELDEKLFDEVLKTATEKVPGLGYVASLVTVLLGSLTIFRPESTEFRGIVVSIVALALSIAAYRLGSVLDDWLFDPIFAPDVGQFRSVRRWMWLATKRIREGTIDLNAARENAARVLHLPLVGIYSETAMMFERTHAWEKHVKVPLELSKAARAFVLPALAVTLYEVMGSPWGLIASHVRPTILSPPILPAVLLAAMTNAYIRLRIMHMEELYKLAERVKEEPARAATNVRVFRLSETSLRNKPVTYRVYFWREQQPGLELTRSPALPH